MCIHCLGHPPTQTSEQNLVLSWKYPKQNKGW
jgi:hypothetical protein